MPKDGEPMVPHPLGTRLPSSSELLCAADRVGMYELRTAGSCCPALPFVLELRCECELYGTAASQVKVLCGQGAQCGSMGCFYGANLRALAFLLLSHPEFSHKMRISTRSNKIFQCARRVIFSGGASHLTDSENAPVGRFPVTLWIIKIFLWNIFRKAVVGSANQVRKSMQCLNSKRRSRP